MIVIVQSSASADDICSHPCQVELRLYNLTQMHPMLAVRHCCITVPSFVQAHRDVVNVLLSVLDDGRLTDSQGRTVSFANTVIIMTSNLGSDFLLQHDNSAEARSQVMQVVKTHFRPELLNRLDEIVVFEPLNKMRLREVARMQAAELNQRLKSKNIILEMTDAALDYVVAESYDHLYGARPLRRWLEHHVITDLSRMIVSGMLLLLPALIQLPSRFLYCQNHAANISCVKVNL